MNTSLLDYGLVPFFVRQASLDEIGEGRIARVTEVQRSLITLIDGAGERSVALTTPWQKVAPEDRPTVGDWVVLDDDSLRIERILDRKSVFRRISAGDRTEIQLIAANVDVLFIVTSCNEEFKESRLERYLALAVEAGVTPVVVLTKADLTDDTESYVERARGVHPSVPIESINALDETTFDGIKGWLEPGSTMALVGSSGVGKSTLLNTLAETNVAVTSAIRDDDKKGRHATTHRALFRLASGALVIDVPGIRELKVAEVDDALEGVFDDISAMSANCRFTDCRHESEPGCAVRNAVENGALGARRLRNYQKLLRENERNSVSLAERRSRDRDFAKLVKQAKTLKQGQGEKC